jgi:hypothetical protein
VSNQDKQIDPNQDNQTDPNNVSCLSCAEPVAPARWAIGYRLCLSCGEQRAGQTRKHWCIAPMHKSNYMLITDLSDLRGLNNKGGLIK